MTTPATRRTIVRTGALLVVLGLLRWLAVEPYLLAGRSMYPTFRPRDYVLVEKLSARLLGYRRGDVVLFQENAGGLRGLKRIVALPGDTVRVVGDGVTVDVPGAPARQVRFQFPHRSEANAPPRFDRLTLRADEYFLVGDNWDVSRDSREFGPLPAERLRGKALLRIFPRPGLVDRGAVSGAIRSATRGRPGDRGDRRYGFRSAPSHRDARPARDGRWRSAAVRREWSASR
jgi:signal peptidase I